jgi:DNA-binding transcriptional MocR family regulator
LPIDRRLELARIAQSYDVPIIEDDTYGALAINPPSALAALAPEQVYYIASLSKSLAPALRVAYLVTPNARVTSQMVGAIRATASMVTPLTSAIATQWIEDGTAESVLAAIKSETKSRQAIARKLLPPQFESTEGAFHLWLKIDEPWTRGEFVARLRLAGVVVVASDAFAVSDAPEAVRLGLGVPGTREELELSLRIVADFLESGPSISSMIV